MRSTRAVALRLKIIFDGVREVVARYAPDCASVEIVFVNVSPQSTLLLGQARGAAIAALAAQGLEVAEYTALQMKKAIVGHGQARRNRCRRWSRGCSRCPVCLGRTPPTRSASRCATPTPRARSPRSTARRSAAAARTPVQARAQLLMD